MNITINIDDFGLLWHTASNAEGLEITGGRFEHVKGTPLAEFKPGSDYYMYWLGENALQALVALRLLQGEGHAVCLLWDTADDDPDYCLLTSLDSYDSCRDMQG